MSVEADIHAEVTAFLGHPPLAIAPFQVRWSDEDLTPLMRLLLAVRLGHVAAVLLGGSWAAKRWRSRLPSSAYLAITEHDLHAFEFRFGPLHLRREVARWPRREVVARRRSPFDIDLTVDGRTIELSATHPGPAAAAVIDLLTATA